MASYAVCKRGMVANAAPRVGRRAEKHVFRAEATEASAPSTSSSLPVPEWLPEQAKPALAFLESTTFDLKDSALYKEKLAPYVSKAEPYTGFKQLPELINGRAAMLGFVAGASAEIFGAGPLLKQLSIYPQPVLVAMALITAGSIIPIVKGTEGGYLDSLFDTYSLPKDWFTQPMERLHARLAMLGVGGLVLLELIKGSAVL